MLFVRDLSGGGFYRDETVSIELYVVADATDLRDIDLWSDLATGLEVTVDPVDGTYLEEDHRVAWFLPRLDWGDSTLLTVRGRILPDLELGDAPCVTATLSAATPLSEWQSDAPDCVGFELPACVSVR